MDFLLAKDTISGKEGSIYATINGEIKPFAHVKSISAKVTKNKKEVKTLGQRGSQYKATGYNATGSVTFYYVSTDEVQMMIDYMKTGVDTYFMIVINNVDLGSKIGTQSIMLEQVNFDEMEFAKLDTEADTLERTTNFTFTGAEILSKFQPYL